VSLATMLYLHDRYALDGDDPNTHANILVLRPARPPLAGAPDLWDHSFDGSFRNGTKD
jgi:hypothetical protein